MRGIDENLFQHLWYSIFEWINEMFGTSWGMREPCSLRDSMLERVRSSLYQLSTQSVLIACRALRTKDTLILSLCMNAICMMIWWNISLNQEGKFWGATTWYLIHALLIFCYFLCGVLFSLCGVLLDWVAWALFANM